MYTCRGRARAGAGDVFSFYDCAFIYKIRKTRKTRRIRSNVREYYCDVKWLFSYEVRTYNITYIILDEKSVCWDRMPGVIRYDLGAAAGPNRRENILTDDVRRYCRRGRGESNRRHIVYKIYSNRARGEYKTKRPGT